MKLFKLKHMEQEVIKVRDFIVFSNSSQLMYEEAEFEFYLQKDLYWEILGYYLSITL